MKTVLFLGGCADGKRIDVKEPLRQYYDIPEILSPRTNANRFSLSEPTVFKKVFYRLETLACGCDERQKEVFFLYVEEGINAYEMLRMLLDGYRRM
jgi:hypothetical protein